MQSRSRWPTLLTSVHQVAAIRSRARQPGLFLNAPCVPGDVSRTKLPLRTITSPGAVQFKQPGQVWQTSVLSCVGV